MCECLMRRSSLCSLASLQTCSSVLRECTSFSSESSKAIASTSNAFHTLGRSFSGSPRRKMMPCSTPLSRRRLSISRRLSMMNSNRVSPMFSGLECQRSSTKTGNTVLAPSQAASSAGWSCIRRPLRSHINVRILAGRRGACAHEARRRAPRHTRTHSQSVGLARTALPGCGCPLAGALPPLPLLLCWPRLWWVALGCADCAPAAIAARAAASPVTSG
mmetsp:Transcript_1243/g.3620  ORF Transcript_1243/g.3620 Transcript_1243/m.3620 type:complete len:218 (+) Transcript_1243:1167-1820(+)